MSGAKADITNDNPVETVKKVRLILIMNFEGEVCYPMLTQRDA